MLNIEGIHSALAGALEKRGYETLTPVQEAVIEPELATRDLLVSAQTGSGKTVAFGLAFAANLLGDAQKFSNASSPFALVVAPTRELALQVERELTWLYNKTGASIASCVGGMDMRKERRALARGAHIVVGTPGRLRDHIDRGGLDLSEIRVVVLDEADEMLDLGFREDLEYILDATPTDRRTLLFSATVPRPILNLAKQYQNNAERISTAAEKKQHVDIEYRALLVSHRDVENGIINVLRYYEAQNTIVFCATRAAVARMTSRFSNRGFSVVALSGELSQDQRSHALQAMRDGRARVCIATDVAARGIDLPNLELVIHADLPTNKETLLHRSGRTGRAGRKGVSALMVPANLKSRAERLLRHANVKADWAHPPSVEDILARDDERILYDPMLLEEIQEEEKEFIAKLTSEFSSEQLAAAFVRHLRQGKSAPEELMEVKQSLSETRGSKRDNDGGRRQMAEFENGKWISLSVGRNQRAEPRWLLPMLCKASNLTKRNIGSIKIRNEETFVEIAEQDFDSFLQTVGPNMVLEKSIRVGVIDGVPEFDQEQPRRNRGKSNTNDQRPDRGRRRRDSADNRSDLNTRDRQRDDAHPREESRRTKGKKDGSRQDQKRQNTRNRERALEELSAISDVTSKPTDKDASGRKKTKKSKKSKTVKFSGLKKKKSNADRSQERSTAEAGKGKERDGMAPRKRPKKKHRS